MRSRALILAGATAASLTLIACGTEPNSSTGNPTSPTRGETSAKVTYVALGDSLATTYGGASVAYPTLYGEAAAEALGKEVVVENEAVPGITSGDLVDMLKGPGSSYLKGKLAEAAIVTVQIGVNDFRDANDAALEGDCAARGNLVCHDRALRGVKENLRVIVQEILSLRSKSDTIIRFIDNYDRFPGNNVFRRRGFPKDYSETIRPFIQEWNEFTCNLAESREIPCVSLYEAFNGPRGDESPYQEGLLQPDGDHLSDKGHKAVAAELAEVGFAPLA